MATRITIHTETTASTMATNETFGCTSENIPGFNILVLVVYSCCAVIICDTIIVTFVIWRTPALRTSTNILFASLTVTDVLLCVAFITAQTLNMPTNNILSNFLIGASIGVIQTWLMHMTAIAIDRYLHVVHPFFYMKNMTKGVIVKTLVGIWTVGLLYTFTPMMAFTEDEYHDTCIILHPPKVYYFIGCIGYVLNIIAVFTCYLKIACLAFQHKKAANARRLHNKNTDGTVMFRSNLQAALRSVKFFAIMFGILAFCTLPPMLCSGISQYHTIPDFILMPVMCMMLINSIANVFIYMFTNKEFSKALLMTCSEIKQCWCQKHY